MRISENDKRQIKNLMRFKEQIKAIRKEEKLKKGLDRQSKV